MRQCNITVPLEHNNMCSLSLALRKVGMKYPHNLQREFGVYGQFSTPFVHDTEYHKV